MAEGGSDVAKPSGHGLLLYHFFGSSYSQKVLLALHEKKLHFKSSLVDLTKGENFKPWYLKLNPKGEVPVLTDGVKVIPDSHRIIEYLEDNFSNGNHPRLLPEKGTEEAQKVKEMQKMLENVMYPVLTFGSVLHPELVLNQKMSRIERQARLAFFENAFSSLDKCTEKYPEFEAQYSSKKNKLQELFKLSTDVAQVKKTLDDLEVTFDVIEKELASHTGDKENWWLCSENFTIADILLTLLLHRMDHIGFSQRFFGGEKRPNVQKYYKHVQKRDSFKRTFNFCPSLLAVIPSSHLALSIAGAFFVVGFAVAAAFAYKKLK